MTLLADEVRGPIGEIEPQRGRAGLIARPCFDWHTLRESKSARGARVVKSDRKLLPRDKRESSPPIRDNLPCHLPVSPRCETIPFRPKDAFRSLGTVGQKTLNQLSVARLCGRYKSTGKTWHRALQHAQTLYVDDVTTVHTKQPRGCFPLYRRYTDSIVPSSLLTEHRTRTAASNGAQPQAGGGAGRRNIRSINRNSISLSFYSRTDHFVDYASSIT